MHYQKINGSQLETIKISLEKGLTPKQIKDKFDYPVGVRQLQRIAVKLGLNKGREEAYRIAVSQGRLGGHKKQTTLKRIKIPPKLRYLIFRRDNFKCQICGITAKERILEIDHKDFNVRNNDPLNLQVLCEWCNFGRYKI